MIAELRPLVAHAPRAALLVDFDGTLAPIIGNPDVSRPLPAARDALAGLVGLVARVAVVSGRPAAFLRDAIAVDGVTYVGQYGLERFVAGEVVTDPRVAPYLEAVAEAAAEAGRDLPGVGVERKGPVAVALHWRNRPEMADETQGWAVGAAQRLGLALHPGKMVIELRPPVPVDKGDVVEALSAGLVAAAFAGDDAGDLAAFDALDRLRADGRLQHTVRIAVRSAEEPPDLVARADVRVDGPAELAVQLHELAEAIRRAPA